MNILMIVPGGVHESGRICVIPALVALIRRLSRRHELTVVALRQYREPREYMLHGARVINLGFSGIPRLDAYLHRRLLKRLLKRELRGFDVVHAFWLDEPGSLAVMAGKMLKIPVVASLGGGEMMSLPHIGYGGQRRWLSRQRIRRVLRSASMVTAGSRYAMKDLEGASWVPLFPEMDRLLEVTHETEGPPWMLITTASINKVKDPFTMLEALKIIIRQQRDTYLEWIGEDTLGGKVERRAERMGLKHHVAFPGFRAHDLLPSHYQHVQLYVQSSLHESQGVAVCEAAAAGVSVVGTDVGILNEMSPNMASAVPGGDARALAAAVLEMIEDSDKRAMVAGIARSWARALGPEWTAERFESIYTECVS